MAKSAKSPSNLESHVGVSSTASAGKAGSNGSAGATLAMVFAAEDKAQAKLQIKLEGGMKGRLEKLMSLTKPDHKEFRAQYEAQRNMLLAAKPKDVTVDVWRKTTEDGRIYNIVGATVSLWLKMSTKLEAGWQPGDIKSKLWAEISKAASDWKPPVASPAPQSQAQIKAAEAAKVAATVTKGTEAVTKALGIKPGEALPESAKAAIVDVVATTCMYCTIEELDQIMARLTTMRNDKVKAREEAAKAIAKGAASAAKPEEKAPETPVEKPATEASNNPGRALAAGEKGTPVVIRKARRVKA